MKRLLVGSIALLLLAGCGGEGDSLSYTEASKKTPVPTPTPSPTPTPTPTPTPSGPFSATNDGLVQTPAAFSTDTAQYGKRLFQGIPTIAVVGKRIWAVWTGDNKTGLEASTSYLVLSYSDNGGKSWSREFYLVPPRQGIERAFDARLWLAPDGKLWVFYTAAGGSVDLDGQLGTWVGVISDPQADTPDFEPGFWLSDGLPQRPFAYKGQYYYEIDYLSGKLAPRHTERDGEHFFRLNWQNRTASWVVKLPQIPNADFNEGQFAVLNDDSLLYQSRSLDGMYQSRAADERFAFSTPAKWTFFPSAASRHFLGRTPEGRLIMVWNQSTPPTRANMTVALSNDDGATWPISYTFDTRQQISYPDVAYQNGDILIIYDHSRDRLKNIWMARINESQLAAGRPAMQQLLVNQATAP